jgi:hypothetical protein
VSHDSYPPHLPTERGTILSPGIKKPTHAMDRFSHRGRLRIKAVLVWTTLWYHMSSGDVNRQPGTHPIRVRLADCGTRTAAAVTTPIPVLPIPTWSSLRFSAFIPGSRLGTYDSETKSGTHEGALCVAGLGRTACPDEWRGRKASRRMEGNQGPPGYEFESCFRFLCQLPPVMGPAVFGQDGPLAQVTLVES